MKRIVIWVEDEVKEQLNKECFEEGKTQTEVITKLITKHCKKGKK